MNTPAETKHATNVSDQLAAERTFLAWIRTSIAMMGFGFVVARFGLFLQQLQVIQHVPSTQSHSVSRWFGTTLIIAGVVTIALSARNHVRLIRELDQDAPPRLRSWTQSVAIALIVALLGLTMAIYLVVVQTSADSPVAAKEEAVMASTSDNGIISKPSNHSVDETVARLVNILQAKGVAVFALIDHSGEAEKVGLKMRPTKLLIFGSPKAGTPLMLAAPTVAIDLPLKILVWEDAQGKVWVSYNSPAYLQQRHAFPPELLQNIVVVETLAAKTAQ
jgi:uncharacterized protein (DUF302 family)/uncharacterized membrane protein YidH (DUF202 family)